MLSECLLNSYIFGNKNSKRKESKGHEVGTILLYLLMTAWTLHTSRRLPKTPGSTVSFIARTIYTTITSAFRVLCYKSKKTKVKKPF